MISTRRLTFAGAAILLSGASVVLTQQWLQGQVQHAQMAARVQVAAPAAAARVLVAAEALPAGAILKPSQLRWQTWPADLSTSGYFTAATTTAEQLAGAVVRSDLAAGEPLSTGRVVQPGDRSFLAAVLTPGYRAVTVNVSANTGVAGFVLPGDRVDLILSRSIDAGGAAKRFMSETVISDIRVVGVDQRSNNTKKDVVVPQTVTLEVTPKQAEVISLVTELGKLSLSLRSLATPADASAGGTVSRTWDTEGAAPPSTGGSSRPAVRKERIARAAPPAAGVEVVRGTQTTSVGASQ